MGAFDAKKIAFLRFSEVRDIFYNNDVDWSVTPSNHKTEQFQKLLKQMAPVLRKAIVFDYVEDRQELEKFVKKSFYTEEYSKYQIDKNNFTSIYFKWLKSVRDTIDIDWKIAKSNGILDADFYLADLLADHNKTIKNKLYAILNNDHYEFNKKRSEWGSLTDEKAEFKDGQEAHRKFWSIYDRPPREEFWDYIIARRDLLVGQDVRERKGAFFTPQIWVEKSQEYLAKILGEDWQSEYYVWDCAGGTGNLLAGLVNQRNVFVSTLDRADVDVIHERIKNGAKLFANQVFQFDFLNDDFFDEKGVSKLPEALQEILRDEAKRKKLIIYINPPYAEAASATTVTGAGKNKELVARGNVVCEKYSSLLGKASNELFAQFFMRIYREIDGCILASFSKLKYVNSQNFIKFRQTFQARFLGGFIAPAYTFDNVKGRFPIGFLIWDTSIKERFEEIYLDIFEADGRYLGQKGFFTYAKNEQKINNWYSRFYDADGDEIGVMNTRGNDFQNQPYIRITSDNNFNHTNIITDNNLILSCIYLAVRHAISTTWINDRDQFLFPKESWIEDKEFHADCLVFTLFHGQNRITAQETGENHFIPFDEAELGAQSAFKSDFMSRFLKGKIKGQDSLFGDMCGEVKFSKEAQAVFDAGREIFRHYHKVASVERSYNPNASLYDIKEYFQGRDDKGRLKIPSKSNDEIYKGLWGALNEAYKPLISKITKRIYKHGFLRQE